MLVSESDSFVIHLIMIILVGPNAFLMFLPKVPVVYTKVGYKGWFIALSSKCCTGVWVANNSLSPLLID